MCEAKYVHTELVPYTTCIYITIKVLKYVVATYVKVNYT